MFRIDIEDVPSRRSHIRATGEPLGVLRDLAAAGGLEHLRIHHEVLHPGTRSSSPHYHTKREEWFYVLEGVATVWCNGETTSAAPGVCVAFPPLPDVYHYVRNDGAAALVMLVVSAMGVEDNVKYLPGSVAA